MTGMGRGIGACTFVPPLAGTLTSTSRSGTGMSAPRSCPAHSGKMLNGSRDRQGETEGSLRPTSAGGGREDGRRSPLAQHGRPKATPPGHLITPQGSRSPQATRPAVDV